MAESKSILAIKRYDLLDGMRGIASIIILWLHIACVCKIYTIPRHAFLAVDFFFCLSGFIIAHAYINRSEADQKVLPFVRRRAARLMPLAIFGSIIGGCFLLFRSFQIGDVSPISAIAATLLNSFLLPTGNLISVYPEAFGADPPLWSLLQEMLASFVFVLGLVRLRTLSLVVVICVSAYITILAAHAAETLDFGSTNVGVWCGPFRVMYPFACGVLIQRLPIIGNRQGYLATLMLAALLLLPIHNVDVQLISVIMIFPLIIYVGAGAKIGPGLANICRGLGAISYPVYVVNYPVIRFVDMGASQAGFQSPALIATMAAISSLVASIAAMRIAEPLIRRYLFAQSRDICSSGAYRDTSKTAQLTTQ